jgi:hypothetical protein
VRRGAWWVGWLVPADSAPGITEALPAPVIACTVLLMMAAGWRPCGRALLVAHAPGLHDDLLNPLCAKISAWYVLGFTDAQLLESHEFPRAPFEQEASVAVEDLNPIGG